MNTIDTFFHVGFTWDRHVEFMQRPIIVNAMEICSTEIVKFLINFGADLSKVYEGNVIIQCTCSIVYCDNVAFHPNI